MADFLADHPCPSEQPELTELNFCELVPWKLWIDDSKARYSVGIGIVMESPNGIKTKYGFKVGKIPCSNNQIEYEALIMGLEILRGLKVKFVEIFGDSQLVVNQINGIFKCLNQGLLPYYIGCLHLMSQFKMVSITHVPRYFNQEADEIAQRASGFKKIERKEIDQEALRKFLSSLEERGLMIEMNKIQ